MVLLNSLVALYALWMLVRHLPRALLFVAPHAIRVGGDPQAEPEASGQRVAGELLEQLGFRRLGLRRERGPLGGLDMEVDAWAHEDGTCADAYPVGGRSVAVAFLTTLGDGYQVGTSTFRRANVEGPAGRARGLPGLAPDGALEAHRKEVASLATGHGAPRSVPDLEARIELAQRYYAGIGGRELRRPAMMSLLNTLIALALFGWSVRLALRAMGWLG